MRLKRFRVSKLFGIFDHDIPFKLGDRITILHAPNGYGKTAILQMIAGFFGHRSLSIFRKVEFDTVDFFFEDGATVSIRQFGEQKELFDQPSPSKQYTITCRSANSEQSWSPSQERPVDAHKSISTAVLERFVPFLSRVSARQWRDRRTGDLLSYHEAVERFWEHIPPSARRSSPQPEWLVALRDGLHCQLIETQRLTAIKKDGDFGREEAPVIPAVKSYPAELKESVEKVFAESGSLAQALDRTLPSRLLGRMRDATPPPSEETLRARLAELEQQRMRLTKAGLLEKSDDSSFIPPDAFNESTRRILSEYVSDAKQKLDIYDTLLAKVELFTDVINTRFQFKTMKVDRKNGFYFRDITNRVLFPEALSSGEQHELVLIFDLLFKTQRDTLLLIDEPEISLHIAWQKRFLSDLRRIIELSGFDVVLATHSPQLIGSDLDLTVQLEAPKGLPLVAE